MTRSITARPPVPAPLLVLGGVVSVQFGGAIASGLIQQVGAAGATWMRLLIAAALMAAFVRPRLKGHSAAAWRTAVAFGIALGLMNFAFYSSLALIPIGVAVTVEFLGPLALAAVLSRRWSDGVAVTLAAVGVALASGTLGAGTGPVDRRGLVLALIAGGCWAAYVLLSGRTGAAFEGLDGLAVAMVVATAVVAPGGLISLDRWTWYAVGVASVVAVLSSVLPYSLELLALRRLTPTVFGILLSLEPAVAALAGWLVLRERLSLGQVIGIGLVILASTVVLGVGRRNRAVPDDIEPMVADLG